MCNKKFFFSNLLLYLKKMTIGNSPLFKKRLSRLISHSKRGKTSIPRVPRKYKGEPPQHHSDLFTDENPRKTVHGLRFRSREDSKKSIKRLRKLYSDKSITFAHMRQIGVTMEQRSKFHSHPTKGIKEGNQEWKRFNKSFKKRGKSRI
jgi:hypothetical protein